ncbi:hypothetical protein ACFL3T_01180 [Patescibacteria group bacterium]
MKKLALLLVSIFVLTACGGGALKVGQIINGTADIARKTYEHPIDPPEGYPYAAYVRYQGEEIVLYGKDVINCKLGQDIDFKGRVRQAVEVPDGEEEEQKELHVVIDTFTCKGDVPEYEGEGTLVFPIENIFKDHVVYGSNFENLDPIKYDCKIRGGTFNECGSPCEPGVDACIDMCTYTCDF